VYWFKLKKNYLLPNWCLGTLKRVLGKDEWMPRLAPAVCVCVCLIGCVLYGFDVELLQYDEAAERQSSLGVVETSHDNDSSSTQSRAGLTAGVVVGVLAAVVLVTGLIVAAIWIHRRRRQQTTASAGTSETCFIVLFSF